MCVLVTWSVIRDGETGQIRDAEYEDQWNLLNMESGGRGKT